MRQSLRAAISAGEPVTGIAQAFQPAAAQAGIKISIIPGDGKQTLTKYRARNHDIYIGQWGSDYWDERELIRRALEAGKPLLGICHGMQMIGECLGGTVAKDLPDINAAVTPHIPSNIPDELAHDIRIEPGSALFAWHRESVAQVNSLLRHDLMGEGRYRVAAWATDGLIEAFEGVAGGFCLGVQWHPEYRLTRLDRTILAAFVRRCAGDAKRAAPA